MSFLKVAMQGVKFQSTTFPGKKPCFVPSRCSRWPTDSLYLMCLCRVEIHRVEEQIKRRVAIGSFVSERKLVDELVRCVGVVVRGGGGRGRAVCLT